VLQFWCSGRGTFFYLPFLSYQILPQIKHSVIFNVLLNDILPMFPNPGSQIYIRPGIFVAFQVFGLVFVVL